ncbi:MAG: LLM class F420-dependent oxidoreductase [Micromonosporaceae bacterium]|nr:LLM class F420-dependent oxidoreductase [Micromonosporaceae bacterium]
MALSLGVMPVLSGRVASDPQVVADLVGTVEELGCESIWAVEHVVIPDTYASTYPYDPSGRMSLGPGDDVPDPLHWLTFAAAHSRSIRLGTAMLILPEHNPVHLAKRLATVDVLSGGRLIAGVGVGWLKEEYDAVGVPFADRGRRADEYLAAMRALWTQRPASFAGTYVNFADVHCEPRPVRAGGVPIVVGGHSPAAIRRAARFGDGLYPLGIRVTEWPALVERLRRECELAGRDPAEVELTAPAPSRPAAARARGGRGAAPRIMRVQLGSLPAVRDDVTRYRDTVLP